MRTMFGDAGLSCHPCGRPGALLTLRLFGTIVTSVLRMEWGVKGSLPNDEEVRRVFDDVDSLWFRVDPDEVREWVSPYEILV